MEERISKLLSGAGLTSRRQGEEWIKAGRVTVNGVPAQLGQKADPERDTIAVDGKLISNQPKTVCLMLHKPCGYVTTMSDEQGRPTVADLIADCGYRLYPVGRLDLNSEGLLLMTNDGELTNKLTHPRHEVEKEYQVRVTGPVDAAVPKLRLPMTVDGDRFNGAKVRTLGKNGDSTLLSVTISQGKNRQVRRMCKAAGLTVHRLRRVREGSVRLGDLPSGSWRWLTAEELAELHKA
ncbi:MAG: rRNA pseudouridine synthase [Oscillospiraceae bacterium]|nr:rRNA pseudouridine synthase [Oscillospiraceae bacterium]